MLLWIGEYKILYGVEVISFFILFIGAKGIYNARIYFIIPVKRSNALMDLSIYEMSINKR